MACSAVSRVVCWWPPGGAVWAAPPGKHCYGPVSEDQVFSEPILRTSSARRHQGQRGIDTEEAKSTGVMNGRWPRRTILKPTSTGRTSRCGGRSSAAGDFYAIHAGLSCGDPGPTKDPKGYWTGLARARLLVVNKAASIKLPRFAYLEPRQRERA
jgi:hypothetical protein